MSILNALSILGAGVGRGYQASQAMQREIAEARRKALLEERETAVREKQAATEEGFRAAQEREIEENILGAKGTRTDAERRRSYLQTPVSSSSKFNLDLMGNKVQLPATMETLLDPNMSDLLARLNEERNRKEGGYYQNVGGGSRAPESLELVLRLMRRQPPPLVSMDPDRLAEWEAAEDARIMQNLPRYVQEFDKIRSGKSGGASLLGVDPNDPMGILRDDAVYGPRDFLVPGR